jgi:hypothetical protein
MGHISQELRLTPKRASKPTVRETDAITVGN